MLKIGETVVRVSSCLDPGETPSLIGVSSGSMLFAYGITVVSSRLRVKHLANNSEEYRLIGGRVSFVPHNTLMLLMKFRKNLVSSFGGEDF